MRSKMEPQLSFDWYFLLYFAGKRNQNFAICHVILTHCQELSHSGLLLHFEKGQHDLQ